MVRLGTITPNNYRECLDLKVSEEQNSFVSANDLSLAKAYVFYDIVKPFAIYDDNIMIGFIMLRFNKEYNNYFIWQFMIDETYQSKGYGKQTLDLVIDWVKTNSSCNDIVTTYIAGNYKAKRLYEKLGFVEFGKSEDDEVDMVLHMDK